MRMLVGLMARSALDLGVDRRLKAESCAAFRMRPSLFCAPRTFRRRLGIIKQCGVCFALYLIISRVPYLFIGSR